MRDYLQNRTSQRFDPVFLDETWIFSRGSLLKTWNDNTPKSCQNKPLGEGKRFIVLGAGNKDGFIPNTTLIFSSKRQTDDYHDNMDADLFFKWFTEQLLPNLKRPSLIIMDNASYHSRQLNKIPSMSATKNVIIQFLNNININVEPTMTKRDLINIVQKNKPPIRYEIDEEAEKWGHKILRLPPYYCEFNAIELIWANCKTYYNKHVVGFNDDAVKLLWKEATERTDSKTWTDAIGHIDKVIDTWWETERLFDQRTDELIITFNGDEDTSDTSDDDSNVE